MFKLTLHLKSILFLVALVLSTSFTAANSSGLNTGNQASKTLRDPTQPLGYRTPTGRVDTLQLNSILVAQGRKVAVINGRQYRENQSHGSVRVLSIDQQRVVVSHDGQRRTLVLHRSIRQ